VDEALARRCARSAVRRDPVIVSLTCPSWAGSLGGRNFDVLMTRLPLVALQATSTAPRGLAPIADPRRPRRPALRGRAQRSTRRWITPHSHIAQLAGAKAGSRGKCRRRNGRAASQDQHRLSASALGRKAPRTARGGKGWICHSARRPCWKGGGFWDGVHTTQ
jgi:hypothetical protein